MNPELKAPVKSDLTKNIITGSGDFDEIVGTSVFVDKTLFIKEVITSGDKATLITCRRSRKSPVVILKLNSRVEQ